MKNRIIRIALIAVIAAGVGLFQAKKNSGPKNHAAFVEEMQGLTQWSSGLQQTLGQLMSVVSGAEFNTLMANTYADDVSPNNTDFMAAYKDWKTYSKRTLTTVRAEIIAAQVIPKMSDTRIEKGFKQQYKDLQSLFDKTEEISSNIETQFERVVRGEEFDSLAMDSLRREAAIELTKAQIAMLENGLLMIGTDHPNYSLTKTFIAASTISIADINLYNTPPEDSAARKGYLADFEAAL